MPPPIEGASLGGPSNSLHPVEPSDNTNAVTNINLITGKGPLKRAMSKSPEATKVIGKKPRVEFALSLAETKGLAADLVVGRGGGASNAKIDQSKNVTANAKGKEKEIVSGDDEATKGASGSSKGISRSPSLSTTGHPENKVAQGIEDVASSSITMSSETGSPSARIDAQVATSLEAQEAEIARLRKELATQNELVEKHQTTLGNLQNLLQCQICLELLWKPFTLTPCGHVCCQSCLQQWFTAPAPGEDEDPAHTLHAPERRKKVCPCCRTEVRGRPVATYLIKSAVAALAPAIDVPRLVDGRDPDPWAGIFPKSETRDPRLAPGGGAGAHPIYDEEDGGVPRCSECLFEIWDSQCVGCGRYFDGVGGQGGEDAYWSGSEFDGPGVGGWGGPGGGMLDLEEEGYESSFIEDDDHDPGHDIDHGHNHGHAHAHGFGHQGRGRGRGGAQNAFNFGRAIARFMGQAHPYSEDEDEDGDVEFYDAPQGHALPGDEEEDDDDAAPPPRARHPIRVGRARAISISSDEREGQDEEDDEDDAPVARPLRRLAGRGNRHAPIVVGSSDEDDDEVGVDGESAVIDRPVARRPTARRVDNEDDDADHDEGEEPVDDEEDGENFVEAEDYWSDDGPRHRNELPSDDVEYPEFHGIANSDEDEEEDDFVPGSRALRHFPQHSDEDDELSSLDGRPRLEDSDEDQPYFSESDGSQQGLDADEMHTRNGTDRDGGAASFMRDGSDDSGY